MQTTNELTHNLEEKHMTSAIHEMTVADVRKALSLMRKEWAKHSNVKPFFPSYKLTNDLTISEFSFKFVLGHHAKRHAKSD
jgi:hypothetical protein